MMTPAIEKCRFVCIDALRILREGHLSLTNSTNNASTSNVPPTTCGTLISRIKAKSFERKLYSPGFTNPAFFPFQSLTNSTNNASLKCAADNLRDSDLENKSEIFPKVNHTHWVSPTQPFSFQNSFLLRVIRSKLQQKSQISLCKNTK